MIPELEAKTGEKFPKASELHTDETNKFLRKVLEKVKVECSEPKTNSRMIDALVGEFIEETAINPTFIMGKTRGSRMFCCKTKRLTIDQDILRS